MNWLDLKYQNIRQNHWRWFQIHRIHLLSYPAYRFHSLKNHRLRFHFLHGFASGNAKIEQRFLLGTGAKRFTVRRAWMNEAQRIVLRNFWESKYGPYGAFIYN